MASSTRKLYIAQCPKCNEPLKEISYVPVYRCGSCNTILLANCWKIVLDRVASGNPESIPPQKDSLSTGGNSNESMSDSSTVNAWCTSDAVNQVTKNKAEKKNDVDDVDDPFGSGSYEEHTKGDLSNNEDPSYLKDANIFYKEQDKESLSPVSFDEHVPRDESDNETSIITSLSNTDSYCLTNIYNAYNEQDKYSLPPNPISESIFYGRVEDERHNWDVYQVQNLTVNNDKSVEASDHYVTSGKQFDLSFSNKTAVDAECPDVPIISYPDEKCRNYMPESTETLNLENLECNSSQNQSSECISSGRSEDKTHYLNAAGQTEIFIEKNEELVDPSDDPDKAEKVLVDGSPSNEAIGNTEYLDIHLHTPYENVASSSGRCGNPTSEEPRIWKTLECFSYEQHSPELVFSGRKEDKGKNLDSNQVETSSVVTSTQIYKTEEVLIEEIFSNGVVRDIESPNIHFDVLNGNVSPSCDEQWAKGSHGEHEHWNIEKPEYNPYQRINSFDPLDSKGSLMMHQTNDNIGIGDSSSGSNFCYRVETNFIDVESSTTSTENTEGFQESVSRVAIQQVFDHNLSTGGTDNIKPARQPVDMYPHEEENVSGDESCDCPSTSMDAIEKSTCLVGNGIHDKTNDGFTTALPEIIEDENYNVIAQTNSPTCHTSRTRIVEFTDCSVIEEETTSLKADISKDASLPIHASFLDIDKYTLQNKSDAGQCTFGNGHESLICMVDVESNSNKNDGETVSSKYDCNEMGHEDHNICDQTNDCSIYAIFNPETLIEETEESSNHFCIHEEAVYRKPYNETDIEVEFPMNMLSNTVFDVSKGGSDAGPYTLSATKESMFSSVVTAKTHIKGDLDNSDQICSSSCSERCICVNEQGINSPNSTDDVKTSKTVTEERESANLVFQGKDIEQDLNSAGVRCVEHSVLMYPNSLLKKASGNGSSSDQHNASKQLILDAACCDNEKLATDVVFPSSPPQCYGFKEENEYNANASMQLFLDDATCDKEILENDVISPLSTLHHCSTKECLSDYEGKNESNDSQQIGDFEHTLAIIPTSPGGNDESTSLVSTQERKIDQDLLGGRSIDIQYPIDMCNLSLQLVPEKGTDHVHSTLGIGNECLPRVLLMGASEKDSGSYGPLGNDNDCLLGSFISTTPDQENKNDDDAVSRCILSLPISKHAIDDKVKGKVYNVEDDVCKSQTSRPIEDLEETYNHFAVSKEASELNLLDEGPKNMTVSIHMSNYLLINFTEKESPSNPCVLNSKDIAFCLSDGNTDENEKESCAAVTDGNTVCNSGQINVSNCMSNGTRILGLQGEKEEVLRKEAGDLCIMGKDRKLISSNNMNSDAHGGTFTFSNSGRWDQIKPENLVFQKQESFSSKCNSYGSNYDGHGLKDGQVFPNTEISLCSITADINDNKPGRYIEKHTNYSLCTLKSEQITEKIGVTEACSELNELVGSFYNQPSNTISHRSNEVSEHVKDSSGSHFFEEEVTAMNHKTTRYALSPIHKSSLDRDGGFSSIDEVYWNHVSNQQKGRRTSRSKKSRSSLFGKEKNKGDIGSTSNETCFKAEPSASAKTRQSSKHRNISRNIVESLPRNEASSLHPKQDSSSSEGFYSAENRTASESEVPQPRSIELTAHKLVSNHHKSGGHFKSKISEEERRELVKTIDELRNQLSRSHDQTGGYGPTFTRAIEMANQQHLVNSHHLQQRKFQPPHSTSQASRHRAVERLSEKHMFLQMTTSGNLNCYLNQRQEYNQFVNRRFPDSLPVSRPGRVQHIPSGTGLLVPSEPSSPFSSYATPKQEHGLIKVKQHGNHQTRKQHCRPILGGAQFIICNECMQLLRMPEDFQISKKNYKFRCGSCSAVLEFSLVGGIHMIPHIPKQS